MQVRRQMSNLKDITNATSQTAQYDTQAKWLLGNKDILANILVRSVDDFKGMEPSTVVKLIEGEPHIGSVPVDEGHTNKGKSGTSPGDMITGMNSENNVNNEGKLSFDVIFFVRTPDGLSKVIVNIEAQKSEPSTYDIEMRGIFYSARMVSPQKNREFKKIRL